MALAGRSRGDPMGMTVVKDFAIAAVLVAAYAAILILIFA